MDEFAGSRLRFWFACRRGHWDAALELWPTRQVRCARDCGVFWAAFEACIQRALVCAELDRPDEFEAALAPVRPMFAGTGYEHFDLSARSHRGVLRAAQRRPREVPREAAHRPGAQSLRSRQANAAHASDAAVASVRRSADGARSKSDTHGSHPRAAPAAALARREELAVAAAGLHVRSVRSAARRPAARILAQGAEEDDRTAQGDHRVRRHERARAAARRCVLVGRGGRRRDALARRGAASIAQAPRRCRCDHSAGRRAVARQGARVGRRVGVRRSARAIRIGHGRES